MSYDRPVVQVTRDWSSREGALLIVERLQRMHPGQLYEAYVVERSFRRNGQPIYGVREITSAAIRRTG